PGLFFYFVLYLCVSRRYLHFFPTRRSSDLRAAGLVDRSLRYPIRVSIFVGAPSPMRTRVRAQRGDYSRGFPRFCGRSCGLRAGLDRKSTRLNSSHVSISYAVFCLKKKKTCRSAGELDEDKEEARNRMACK